MPALIVLDWNGRTSFEENDVIAVLPVATHPGAPIVKAGRPKNQKTHAFIYCTNMRPDGHRADLLQREHLGVVRPESSAGGVDRLVRGKRRISVVLANLGTGRNDRFLDYHRYADAPNNHKFTWEQIIDSSGDRNPEDGSIRGEQDT